MENVKVRDFLGHEHVIEIPEGWVVVNTGFVGKYDRLWGSYPKGMFRMALPFELGIDIKSFFCVVRKEKNNCCSVFSENFDVIPENFKFCPFCGKELKG